jgi:hypothetical protein
VRRTELLRIRLTPDELADWRQGAERAGLDLSSYVRRCVKEARDLERALERQEAREAEAALTCHLGDPVEARRRDWGRLRS